MECEWEWQNYTGQDPWQESLSRSQARRQKTRNTRLLRRIGWMLLCLLMTLAIGMTLERSGSEAATKEHNHSSPHKKTKAAHIQGWLPAKTPYRELILRAAAETGMEPALLAGLVETESDFNPEEYSSAGAMGLTQVIQETADFYGAEDMSDPYTQLLVGAKEFQSDKKRFGSTELALAAYNAGPGAVIKYGGIPPYQETQNYVPRVLEYRKHYLRK